MYRPVHVGSCFPLCPEIYRRQVIRPACFFMVLRLFVLFIISDIW